MKESIVTTLEAAVPNPRLPVPIAESDIQIPLDVLMGSENLQFESVLDTLPVNICFVILRKKSGID